VEMRIGQVIMFTEGCKVEHKKKIADLKKEILSFLTETCVIPLGTRWGPDATIKVTIDGDKSNIVIEPMEPKNDHQAMQIQFPKGASWLDWEQLCCATILDMLSHGGSVPPLAEAKHLIENIMKGNKISENQSQQPEPSNGFLRPLQPRSIVGFSTGSRDFFGGRLELLPGYRGSLTSVAAQDPTKDNAVVTEQSSEENKKPNKFKFKITDFKEDQLSLCRDKIEQALVNKDLLFLNFDINALAMLINNVPEFYIENSHGDYRKFCLSMVESKTKELWVFSLYNDGEIIVKKKKKDKQKEVPPLSEGYSTL